ncbi:MAG: hypothetical protein HY303_06420 [Candidatus Wallbacteria bacterium]|nr:hypothetical protein [Candidatus Wallbacteria bacterium]
MAKQPTKPASPTKPRKHRKTRSPKTEAKKFVSDLLIRGEAVPATTGPLPAGATHEIVGTEPDGTITVRRRRFSLT